ncbi:MAG TPA: hypothetical protein VHP13_07750 [Gammaproteobacteria bacterium]|jgi:hypothetical protein|nr:hypothetical protein [Gammaproteobacteria bacterium]
MRRVLLACGLLAFSGVAAAADDITVNGLVQTDFNDLSQDLGAVTSYKQLQGSASEGIAGFDFSFNAGATQVSHEAAWKAATGSDVSTVPFANVSVSKGLPFGFDVGGEYAFVPGSNVHLYGVQARYALVDGGVIAPAVGLRAAYTHLTGVDNLSFNTKSLGISVSKGFGPVTPYAGVGEVWTDSTPDASTGLKSANFSNTEFFAGLTFNLGVHMALEYNHLAGNTTYSFKFGFGF